ncbi:MAG: hypothetical protein HLUCCO16_04425 [Phormidium sp. OSCR]|nr:MAG: hypothetical protein HLUCCO16_04425 [Phormidium sp. OSCR]
MVLYTLYLKNSNTPDLPEVSYQLDLSPSQENNPDSLFPKANRDALRQLLQEKTAASISNANLTQIINHWLDDIREGYRSTWLDLKLAPLELETLKNLSDRGNPSLPPFFPPDFSQISPEGGALPPLNFN